MNRLTEKQSAGYDLKAMNGDYCEAYCRQQNYNSCRECGIYEAIQKLAEYEELEEQGLLLRLPCKNWMEIIFGEQENFWGIDIDYIENPIRQITVENESRITWYDGWKTAVLRGFDENGLDWEFSPIDIGKTVFLTEAEAEAKLKELESE